VGLYPISHPHQTSSNCFHFADCRDLILVTVILWTILFYPTQSNPWMDPTHVHLCANKMRCYTILRRPCRFVVYFEFWKGPGGMTPILLSSAGVSKPAFAIAKFSHVLQPYISTGCPYPQLITSLSLFYTHVYRKHALVIFETVLWKRLRNGIMSCLRSSRR